jgi:Na+-transporting NADH:ubiquinone oxidoreductase subunit E
MEILSIFAASILTQNLALTYILGMCPIIALSKSLKTAFGMGVSVVFVVTLTAVINWPIYNLVLKPTGSEIISLLVFIIVIAATVQFLEMFLEKYVPFLYGAFGIYLPLITVNCVVLAVSLLFVTRDYSFLQALIFALGSSLGWLLAIVAVAAIREKLALIGDVPKGLRGAGIVMVILGILSLGFMGFAGMV